MIKPSIKRKKTRLLLLMLPVVIPGLIISAFGILSISQQKRAKELRLEEQFLSNLEQIRKDVEQNIQDAVDNSYRQLLDHSFQLDQPAAVQQGLKEILLKNPVIRYPFLIDSQGRFIFPFARKSGMTLVPPSLPGVKDKRVKERFTRGEDLEFKERKIAGALKYYLECLEYNNLEESKPYIFNAIARCYFKLGRYPQAISYYRDIAAAFPTPGSPGMDGDLALYFPVLRQLALSSRRMGREQQATRYYLLLYEGLLHYETADNKNSGRFTFFKNEALDYLNHHLQGSEEKAEEKRFKQAKTLDRLHEMSGLDIALRWRYFEYDANNPDSLMLPGQDSPAASRFNKIQEFYLSTDEKTRFYTSVKKMEQWQRLDAPSAKTARVKRLPGPQGNDFAEVVFRGIAENVFFGFMISPGFLSSPAVAAIPGKYLDDPGVRLFILDRGRPRGLAENTGPQGFPLMAVAFQRFFQDKQLVLYVDEDGYFARRARGETRLNYALMAAFILVLVWGIYLFYRYQAREAELVRLKSNFTDSASHTLKTPLTRIRMLAEKLQLGWVSEEAKKQEYLRTIVSETDRMTEMIANMLDFSKIEAGARQYRKEPASLPGLVREVVESYSPYIRAVGFQLQTAIDNELPVFPLDREAVRLVLINLLQNAVKYSAKEKFIQVSLRRSGDNAVLEVSDRGIGIGENDKKKIFEKFYRGSAADIQTVEGSGLGLYLVRHAVHAHRGNITVTGQPGGGTRLTITLPIYASPSNK
jgi:signal transduction histidine kinase/tetratricopeptide (TPR) repeat protein